MPIKINIVLDEDVKSEQERLVKSGMRSRIINKALRQELQSPATGEQTY
jgi:metal-responsive CopG/Arc/MetJ family transcriptional regulator